MGMMVQFPSPALWHQVLAGPPVSREQGTRNPLGGFNDLVHAQLANQNAIAGLQQPPPRPPAISRPGQKEPQKDPRRDPRDPQQQPHEQNRQDPGGHTDDAQRPLIRAVWA